MAARRLAGLLASVCFVTGLTAVAAAADEPAPVKLASGGRALLPVVIGQNATTRVRKAASDLAAYLGRIGGATFHVKTGDGSSGIAVGTAADFPSLPREALPAAEGIAGREAYVLRSHPAGLYVIGATELAAEHAVWDLLHRLGFRQFFPGKTWEVVPETPELAIAVADAQRPDYYARRIWYGFGPWDYAAGPYAEWCTRNRATSGMVLNTGHSYDGILARNRDAFKAHPEYLALVKGERRPAKFCISNPGLRRLVVDDALRWFAENPEADSISRDPSDGGGWCECEACKRMGSVSDRVLILANETAEAVNRKHPGKVVGMYAYASHSPPPGIRVHPRVIVSVATGFIRGGYTVEELIDGWSRQGATLGIREYYSVNTWDRDLPGRARGGNLEYVARTIPEFHAKGARFMSAESSDNWGPNGLGYYLASRILWDVDEAGRADTIVDDFLSRAFGPAKEPMAAFYKLLDGSQETLVVDDLLGRMHRRLNEARRLADSPEITARLNDLVLYTRYVELYHAYAAAKGEARQAAFEALIRHTYRMRKTMMVHAKALYRDLCRRDRQVSIPQGAGWNVAEEKNPWKSSEPFGEAELARLVSEGIAAHALTELGFEPAEFSGKLVPADRLKLAEVKPGEIGTGRGTQMFFTWIKKAPATIELEITGGLIAHYRDRGNVRVQAWRVAEDGEEDDRPGPPDASDRSVPPDGVPRTVRLPVKQPGLYRITVSDGRDMTRVAWKPGVRMTLKSSLKEPLNVSGRWSLYFYVPRGTKVVGFYANGRGAIVDPEGRAVLSLDRKKPGYYHVEVGPGSDGRLWKISSASGAIRLMTVPPYLARCGEELLLPAEVVQRDAGR